MPVGFVICKSGRLDKMNMDTILTILLSVVGGGGMVAIVQAIAGKQKSKSEVTDILVEKAIEIENVATDRYMDVSKTLEVAETYLKEAKEELEVYRSYVSVLKDLLRHHGIEPPEMETFSE